MTELDMKAKAKGMKYKVVAVNGEIETLYCKTLEEVSTVLKDWKGVKFRIHSFRSPEQILRERSIL